MRATPTQLLSRLLLLACLLCTLPAQAAKVVVSNFVLEKFQSFVDGRDVYQINRYEGDLAHREIIELVLLHQALYAGGYRGEIELIANNQGYEEQLRTLESGQIAMVGTTFWAENLVPAHAYTRISSALVRHGEFEAGIYVLPSNARAMQVKTLADLQQLSAVSNRSWLVDWETLQKLQLKYLHNVSYWGGMVKMITAGRADFMLAPLKEPDGGELEGSGFALTPIPKVKLVLHSSRHWALSKKAAGSGSLYQQLEDGIKALRAEGRITRAFTESNFFNPSTRDWVILNPVE